MENTIIEKMICDECHCETIIHASHLCLQCRLDTNFNKNNV